ncbi:MAG: hypothetical protein RLN62_04220 [Rickettsiales bacterium]
MNLANEENRQEIENIASKFGDDCAVRVFGDGDIGIEFAHIGDAAAANLADRLHEEFEFVHLDIRVADHDSVYEEEDAGSLGGLFDECMLDSMLSGAVALEDSPLR